MRSRSVSHRVYALVRTISPFLGVYERCYVLRRAASRARARRKGSSPPRCSTPRVPLLSSLALTLSTCCGHTSCCAALRPRLSLMKSILVGPSPAEGPVRPVLGSCSCCSCAGRAPRRAPDHDRAVAAVRDAAAVLFEERPAEPRLLALQDEDAVR